MVNLSPFLTNCALRNEDVWVSGCTDPGFLEHDTNRRQMVSFTPWPIYHQGKTSRCTLDVRQRRSQNWSGRYGVQKIPGLTGTRISTPGT